MTKQFVAEKQKIEEFKFNLYSSSKNINPTFTPLSCPYDVKFKSADTYCIGEIKVRSDNNLLYFSKYGPYLELKKIEGMQKERERILQQHGIDVKMYYFNFCEDGLQVFLLQEPWKYNFKWAYLPKDNFEPHIKIWKQVTKLYNSVEKFAI